MSDDLKNLIKSRSRSCMAQEEGYILVVVTVMGLILAIILGYVMPQLHTSQMTRAQTDLNEYRAYEAARKGINAGSSTAFPMFTRTCVFSSR